MIAAPAFEDPWRFAPNPEVYLLIAFLIAAYIYSARVIGPRAVKQGPVLTRGNIVSFVGAMTLLLVSSTWPMHQIAEQYLYSVHMTQHMMLAYFMPPLVLMALPEWLLRILIGNQRLYRALRFACHPVTAAVVFNLAVIVTHIPAIVNASVQSAPLHYALHVMIVLTALLMWMPLVGPFREFHIGYGAKCIYLFLQSVVPTVPAGWLTFAEGVVYDSYNTPVRVWGISVTDDQQLAGAVMKLGGSIFLWSVVIFWFFRRFAPGGPTGSYRADRRIPSAEITGHDEQTLTFDEVAAEFERSAAPSER
jgi:putative membrane protein